MLRQWSAKVDELNYVPVSLLSVPNEAIWMDCKWVSERKSAYILEEDHKSVRCECNDQRK